MPGGLCLRLTKIFGMPNFLRFSFSVVALLGVLWMPSYAQDDLMTQIVVPAAPRTPSEFLALLLEKGLPVSTHMVANRGAENPARGSYSVFGDVGPELTFGIFVEPDATGHLVLQEDFDVRLLIEVITVDAQTRLHNFWELIGDGQSSAWHYRGNSLDVIADGQSINMGPTSDPQFGSRLRCSGCHTGGGLVMKERFPYNDWRNGLPLATGPWKNSPVVEQFARNSKPASHLDALVEKSLREYVAALAQRSPESEKAWARSVLAPLEMNLLSDTRPFLSRQFEGSNVQIPSEFFVDSRLSGPCAAVEVPVVVFRRALDDLGSSFAAEESRGLIETEHAFLVPTVSRFDRLRVDRMLEKGLLDEELLADFLAVDFTTPIYSPDRLALMELLPDHWADASELRQALAKKLASRRATDQATDELARNILDDDRTLESHKKRALVLLAKCREQASDPAVVKEWIRLAAQRRAEIQAAQTSQNPRGSILEGGLGSDGFRRIFPVYTAFSAEPYRFRLDPKSARLTER